MVQLKMVTCAVDVTEDSRASMHLAAALANRFGAELTLVFVKSPASSFEPSETLLERCRAEAETLVGAPVLARLLCGDRVAEILREAHDSGCDLLVVGAHDRSSLSRAVLGSVAERLVRGAPCPVLVARDRALASAERDAEEIAQYI